MLDPVPTSDPNEPLVCLSPIEDNWVHEIKLIQKELEHCSQDCQLHHRPRHDRRHIYSVRHQYHPCPSVTPANIFEKPLRASYLLAANGRRSSRYIHGA